MMGLCSGAHLLAKGALVAQERLSRADADKSFLTTRIAVAQFFAEQLLPQAEALVGPVTRGAAGPFSLDADAMGV